MRFNEKLTRLMFGRNTSLQVMARAVGVSANTISNWRAGRQVPPLDKAAKIARFFGVSLDYLGFDELKPPQEADLFPARVAKRGGHRAKREQSSEATAASA
jgi:transcriptional regulator with XRE-family HTH domain